MSIIIANHGILARPSSAWTPESIAGLRFWLDASQITGYSDGNTITTWEDVSSNGMDFTHFTTGGSTPTYETNEINGLPCIHFKGDGTLNGMETANGTDLDDVSGDFSIFGVWQMQSYNGPDMLLTKGDGTASGGKFSFIARWNGDLYGGLQYFVGGSSADARTGITDDGLWRHGSGIRSGSTGTTRINSGALTDSDTLAGSLNSATGEKPTIACAGGGTGFPANIKIAELFFYDVAVAGANLAAVETYLKDKYFPGGGY